MEAERLVPDDAGIKSEARGVKFLGASRMAGIEDRKIVLFRHFVDRGEERREVLFGVDVLFPVRRKKDVLALFQPQLRVNIRSLDRGKIGAQNLRHRGAGDVGALLRQSRVGKIPAGVLGIGEVDVRDDVDDPAIRLLGKALILAAVARLHVEDRDMQTLRPDDRQAGVGVAEHEHGVGLDFVHQPVTLRDDVPHRLAEVGADGVKVDVGIGKPEIAEENAVQIVIIVLPRVREQRVEIAAALSDHSRQPDDLGARADNDEKLQFAVVLKTHISPPLFNSLTRK